MPIELSGTPRWAKARSIVKGCGALEPSRSNVKPFPNRSRVERPSASQACGARLPGNVAGRYSTVELDGGVAPSSPTIGEAR
jgi:hypothetical protein